MALVDRGAVDSDWRSDPPSQTQSTRVHSPRLLSTSYRPLRVEQLLEIMVVPSPPELTTGEDRGDATRFPSRPVVGTEDDFTGELHGNFDSPVVLSPDRDQVANAPLRELAFDRRHPGAPCAAVGSRRVQEDARVPHELAAIGPFAPPVLDDQMIIAVVLSRGNVSLAVAADPQQSVLDAEDSTWVGSLRVFHPGARAPTGRGR